MHIKNAAETVLEIKTIWQIMGGNGLISKLKQKKKNQKPNFHFFFSKNTKTQY